MSLARRALVAPLIALVLGGCDAKNSGSYGCGISAVAGQSLLLEEFTRPGKTLSVPPSNIPETLPVRVALGPALRAVAGRPIRSWSSASKARCRRRRRWTGAF